MKRAALAARVLLAVALSAGGALAQTHTPPHAASSHPRHVVHPVPAPSIAPADETHPGKEVEDEEVRPPVKWWDTKILKNPQPPIAALLFNFALLVFIYWRYGKKPVAEALKNRKISIATAIEEAQRMLREAKERSKRYRAKLDKVKDDAEQGKQALVSTGQGEAEAILKGADEKAARLKREAEFLVEQEKKQTDLDLMRETVDKATQEAEELLRKNVTAADQERLAEEFIAKLATDFDKGLPLGGAS